MVSEWVRPGDLAAVQRPAAVDGARFDSWFALPGRTVRGPLRIVFPHDGDVFVRESDSNRLQRDEQELALHAVDQGRAVRWTVDGKLVATDSDGNAFWPLRLGTWNVAATDGKRYDRVTIRVVPPPHVVQPGFTVLPSTR